MQNTTKKNTPHKFGLKHFLLSALMLLSAGTAWADVTINSKNFPDANFRSYLTNQSYGSDGLLTDAEIAEIKSLMLSSKGIQNLNGIKNFTALQYLTCDGNQLTTLDVSGCESLIELDCSNNKLTSLNISGCSALTSIICAQNQLKGAAMDDLIAGLPTTQDGGLYVINVESDDNEIAKDQVQSVKAKGWTAYALDGSWSEYSGIVLINEKYFPDAIFRNYILSQSYGSDSVITDVEIAGVTSINVSTKGIQSLKGIEFFTALTELRCYDNQLTSLDVSKNTKLTTLYCDGNQISGESMDALVGSLQAVSKGTMHVTKGVMTKTQVRAARAKGWIPMVYYSKTGSWIPCGWEDGIDVVEINFPDKSFREYLLSTDYGVDGVLTDKELEEVTSIDVSSKSIQSLRGVEYFTALTELFCGGNQLTSLDVSKNTALIELYCYKNQLTSLDVSGCIAMIILNCQKNQLTSLDVSGCAVLNRLYCFHNQLTSLDVSKNMALTYLSCYDNQFTSLDVSKNIALRTLNCDGNKFTSLDVSKNMALTSLSCGSNQLTSLDVSKNTKLTWLYCNNNQLASLDMSTNTALRVLDCHGNQLSSLDVLGCTELARLDCHDNQLSSLDVLGCTELARLDCHDNQLTSLDVSGCTELISLDCRSNLLTSLDVSKNTSLTKLDCDSSVTVIRRPK